MAGLVPPAGRSVYKIEPAPVTLRQAKAPVERRYVSISVIPGRAKGANPESRNTLRAATWIPDRRSRAVPE